MRIVNGVAYMTSADFDSLKKRDMIQNDGADDRILLRGYANRITIVDKFHGYNVIATEIHHENQYSSFTYVTTEWSAIKDGREQLSGVVMGLEMDGYVAAMKAIKEKK